VVAKNGIPKSSWVCLLPTYQGGVTRNAKTLALQHLQFINVGVGSGPPDRACVVHHGTDMLLVEQCAITDGQTIPPVEDGATFPQRLSRLE
jgi:hypothetical protein